MTEKSIKDGRTDPVLIPPFSVFISYLIEGNGYETRQSSLLYVFVLIFGFDPFFDPAQNTIVVYSVLRF